ncbi:hypothetical protein OQX61_11980 [Pedobacter sp. PLR]|uniref:hypothetical protein n=1 Tax=Pedobacter sp. PLR TaxID=2994465 RepID=UPI002247D7E7|nr:hypothetical protein [Pedobacter sp. PLR]MCX2451982.1 hypothetical protein [Pedobacter sp. PLR]
MKYFSLLFLVIFLSACSKEELYGPYKLKNGQEVELLVDHRYAALGETLLLLPGNKPAELSLIGFTERKPGYTYRVKARFHFEKEPPQDGSDRWFDFLKVIEEQKYTGTETFEISLIKAYLPGGPSIYLTKKDDQYQYIQEKIQLSYASPAVKDQLEEIWQHELEIRESYGKDKKPIYPKWKSVKATVTHDPANFGKAYLVQRIEFTL